MIQVDSVGFAPGKAAWLTRQSGDLPMRHAPSLLFYESGAHSASPPLPLIHWFRQGRRLYDRSPSHVGKGTIYLKCIYIAFLFLSIDSSIVSYTVTMLAGQQVT